MQEEDAHFKHQIGGTMVMIDPFGRTAGSKSFEWNSQAYPTE
jgi:hypothetical protein